MHLRWAAPKAAPGRRAPSKRVDWLLVPLFSALCLAHLFLHLVPLLPDYIALLGLP